LAAQLVVADEQPVAEWLDEVETLLQQLVKWKLCVGEEAAYARWKAHWKESTGRVIALPEAMKDISRHDSSPLNFGRGPKCRG